MLILQQSRNTTLSIKRQAAQSHTKHTNTQKLTTGHVIALQREESAPLTRTHTQVSLTRKPWKLTGSRLHNKEEPQTASLQKGHPKHSHLNKMKRQRNTQQVKEHDKWPPNQTRDRESTWKKKEIRIMIVKMIQNLESKMELQINRLETRIEKIQEMFNEDLEEIKKNQSIMNNAVTEIKITLDQQYQQ